MEEPRAASETITVGAELLAITGLAVNISVGSIACDDGVKRLVAVLAFEALAMPLPAFGEDLFGGEDYTTTTGTTLAWRGLNYSGIDHRCFRRGFSVFVQ